MSLQDLTPLLQFATILLQTTFSVAVYVVETRRRNRLLRCHAGIDEIRYDLYLNLRLHVAALQPDRGVRLGVF